jgi:flagellar FliL protein
MSAAAADPASPAVAVPVKGGKKKLLLMVGVALLVLALVAAGAVMVLKNRAARAAENAAADDEVATAAHPAGKSDPAHPPTFLPLEPFVVNLADKDADRYAQVGITLEVEDAKFAEQMKAFMPAIRNGILMILAHKTSRELLDHAGKEQLAGEILRESARTMGIEVEEPEAAEDKPTAAKAEATDDDEDKPKAKPKKKAHKAPLEPNPIKHVHFSNFIVQ